MFPSMGVYTQLSKLWNNHEREDRGWMGSSRTIKLCRNIVFTLFLLSPTIYPWAGPYWPPCHHRGGYMCVASSHQSMSRPSTVHSCGPVHCTSGVYLKHGTVGQEPETGLLVSFYKASTTGSRTEEIKNCKWLYSSSPHPPTLLYTHSFVSETIPKMFADCD